MSIMRIYQWLPIEKKRIVYFVAGFIILFGVYVFFHLPPKDFPVSQVITVSSGESLQSITNTLYQAHIIRWPFVFQTTVIMLGGEKRVIAGDYLLEWREGPVDLAYRLVKGDFHLRPAKITIPEGWNIFQIGGHLDKHLINFNLAQFLVLTKDEEGYLFPDTYFIFPTTKPEVIISMMKENFDQKIGTVSGISTSTHSLKDIITMASILELEARTRETRRIIAGILWKRLSLGMPLQVDSTFSYINGKNTYDLTADDLKIDSPYNTYKYRGFPPGPIGNPGTDAIIAAITPTTTKYLYYLSEKDGTIHYAKTFEEHKANIKRYLK